MVDEIALISKFERYAVRHADGRFYIGFRDFNSADPEEFYRHASNEIARANKVIAASLPAACDIALMDVVYTTNPEMTDLKPHWKPPDVLAESPTIVLADEEDVAAGWEKMIEEAIGDGNNSIVGLMGLDERHPVVSFCISALSGENFPSYYRAFEALRREFGGEDALVGLGVLSRNEIRRFRDNAQARRHANHEISTKPMHEHEAKLVVLRMLKAYVGHEFPVPPDLP